MSGVFQMLKRQSQLSVRAKVLLTVFTFVGVLFALLYVVSKTLLIESYITIETDAAIQNLDRADAAFAGEVEKYNLQLQDWSPWDDLYSYAENRDPEFKEATLFPEGVVHQNQSAFFLADQTGEIFFAIAMDLETETEISSSSLVAYFSQHRDLIVHESEEDTSLGLITMPEGVAVLTSKPILHNDGTGPVIASVSILRFVDQAMVDRINEKIHLNIKLFPLNDPQLPDDVATATKQLLAGETYVVTPKSEDTIYGYKLIYDAAKEPLLVLRTETPRPIYTQGKSTLAFFSVAGSLAMLLAIIGLSGLLERVVVRRISQLAFDVEHINNEKDISMKVQTAGEDEIGKLGFKINQMLGWLTELRAAEEVSKKEIMKLLRQIKKEKKKADEMVVTRTHELSEEKAKLLASINSLSFGFIIADTSHTIILRNPALSAILQMEEVPHDTAAIAKALTASGSSLDLVALTKKVLKTKAPLEEKEVVFGKKFLRILAAPIFSEDKVNGKLSTDVIGYVLVVDDITEAKNIERSRDEFFSIASHELRTPLTAIRWNTDMLLTLQAEQKGDPETTEMLTDIYDSSIRLISIVGDFLEVSRLEQKKVSVEKKPFDLTPVIQKTMRSLEEMAEAKGLRLKSDQSLATLPQVIGDTMRIQQVVTNLIGNAVKFTANGSVTVSAAVVGKYLKISVSDTGTGIAVANQSRLFKKFQQAGEDMLARDVNQSTGLGLYISKLIMDEMGGSIYLESSTLEKGSVFSFTLPLAPKT